MLPRWLGPDMKISASANARTAAASRHREHDLRRRREREEWSRTDHRPPPGRVDRGEAENSDGSSEMP